MESSRVIVKNIPKHFTEERLREAFSAIGRVTDAKIINTRSIFSKLRDGTSRHFGFIGFATTGEAKQAVDRLHNTFLDTSKVQVDLARPVNSRITCRSAMMPCPGLGRNTPKAARNSPKPMHPRHKSQFLSSRP